ncbi:MAG: hypothetical protein ACI8UP_003140, partial [Porticoccaceae bacterium]
LIASNSIRPITTRLRRRRLPWMVKIDFICPSDLGHHP